MICTSADKGKEVLIVDMGVYTRNRNFRLIYSTKMGKQVFLRPSSINRYIPRTMAESNSIEDKEMTFAWFLSSLVTQVGEFRESESQKVNLLSCEPVPSEVQLEIRNMLFTICSPSLSGWEECAILLSFPHSY